MWNIHDKNEKSGYYDIHNCTNNGIERYDSLYVNYFNFFFLFLSRNNKTLNEMLPPHPSLLHFIEVLEDYSRIRAERIVEIMQGKVIPCQV